MGITTRIGRIGTRHTCQRNRQGPRCRCEQVWARKSLGERNNTRRKNMTLKHKEVNIAQTYRADSEPQASKSAVRGRMQRLGLTLLAFTLVIGVTGTASASQTQDEAAVRALGDGFAKAFVQKNAEQRASLFAENGTFVTPVGDFLQGHATMVKDFGG